MLYLDRHIKDLKITMMVNNNKIKDLREHITALEKENNEIQQAITRKENATSKIVVSIAKSKGWHDVTLYLSVDLISVEDELIENIWSHNFAWNERSFMNEELSRILKEYEVEKVVVKDYKLSSKFEKLTTVVYKEK